MAMLQEKHIKTLDALLGKEISGLFFLRNELQEFMVNDDITQLVKRAEAIAEEGKVKNGGRTFNPKYKFHRLIDADTVKPKIVFQVSLPGNHFHNAEVIGELQLSLNMHDYGAVTFSLPEESEAAKLVRENKWKVSEEELKALDTLIQAARTLQELGNHNFPVALQIDGNGLSLNAHYHDPARAARLALMAG